MRIPFKLREGRERGLWSNIFLDRDKYVDTKEAKGTEPVFVVFMYKIRFRSCAICF